MAEDRVRGKGENGLLRQVCVRYDHEDKTTKKKDKPKG
jgi:hypothetical protein